MLGVNIMKKRKITNDDEQLILYADIKFKHELTNALKWLNSNGLNIKKTKYYEYLGILKKKAYHRLSLLAQDYPEILDEELRKQDYYISVLEEQLGKTTKQIYVNEGMEDINLSPIEIATIANMLIKAQPYRTALIDQTKQVILKPGEIHEQTTAVLSQH